MNSEIKLSTQANAYLANGEIANTIDEAKTLMKKSDGHSPAPKG